MKVHPLWSEVDLCPRFNSKIGEKEDNDLSEENKREKVRAWLSQV